MFGKAAVNAVEVEGIPCNRFIAPEGSAVRFNGVEVFAQGEGLLAILGGLKEIDRVAAVSAATVFSGQTSPDIREGLHPLVELGMVIHRDADGEGAHILLLHAEASYTSCSRDGLKISRS